MYQGKLPMVGGAFGTIAFFFIGVSALIAAPSVAQKVTWGAFGLATSACMYRYAQSSLTARSGGIRVSNPWSRFELPWQAIRRFEIGRWKLSSAVCLIRLRDGTVKAAIGVAEGRLSTGSAERMVAELNEELDARLGTLGVSVASEEGSAQAEPSGS
ncbi:MAG: hypothetical protein WBM00_02485 [Solirubrobacterales bacterium]